MNVGAREVVRFEVLTAECDVTPWSLIDSYQLLAGKYRL
jgi:hypothetical protein